MSGSLWRFALGCCVRDSELFGLWRRRERVAVAGPPPSTALEEAIVVSGGSRDRFLVVIYWVADENESLRRVVVVYDGWLIDGIGMRMEEFIADRGGTP